MDLLPDMTGFGLATYLTSVFILAFIFHSLLVQFDIDIWYPELMNKLKGKHEGMR